MIVLIVLCAYLRTLQGAHLLPLHASSSMAVFDLMGRDASIDPGCGGPRCRTVYSIVQSCLLTIFTCVWTSLHPNINGPRDSDWTCFKRKITTMLCTVIAPEMVLLWALRQRSAAKWVVTKYNRKFAKPEKTVHGETSLSRKVMGLFLSVWGGIMGRFQPVPEETTWRQDGQPWTTTHGFFIQMGGFILYDDGRPKQVLDYKHLADLLQKKAIDAPTVTERELQDRSKGDTISKAIVVLQMTWFVFQCVARAAQHLPLSELEVLTLAFAVINLAIYAAWWDKPQGAYTAICVPLKRSTENKVDGTTAPLGGDAPDTTQSLAGLPHSDLDHCIRSKKRPLILPLEWEPDVSLGEKHSWLQRKLRKDSEHQSTPVFFLLSLPYRIVVSVFRPLGKTGTSDEISQNSLRVPMFGAIHLFAWGSEFPSSRNLILWRVSATVLTVAPFLAFLAVGVDMLHIIVMTENIMIMNCLGLLTFVLMPFYIMGRFVVIIIALLAIHDPPQDVLRDISWTSYIPHF